MCKTLLSGCLIAAWPHQVVHGSTTFDYIFRLLPDHFNHVEESEEYQKTNVGKDKLVLWRTKASSSFAQASRFVQMPLLHVAPADDNPWQQTYPHYPTLYCSRIGLVCFRHVFMHIPKLLVEWVCGNLHLAGIWRTGGSPVFQLPPRERQYGSEKHGGIPEEGWKMLDVLPREVAQPLSCFI